MRRRSSAGGESGKAHRRNTVARKSRIAPKDVCPRSSSAAGKETKVARLARELNEAFRQQTATAAVLKAISRSAFDLEAVLNTLVESAARVCEAERGLILRPTGKNASYYAAASYGHTTEFIEQQRMLTFEPGRGGASGRVLLERRSVQITDVLADPEYTFREAAKLGNFRTILGVPLLREGIPIGIFLLHRTAVRPFTEKQIKLVETFADQAVIAIENTRLFEAEQERSRELTESLEQQTATSEVLQIISSSPGDLEPVFAAMLEKAFHICEAKFGAVYRCEAGTFRFVANHNAPPALAEQARRSAFRPSAKHYFGRMLATKAVVQVADLMTEQGYIDRRPEYVASVELGGVRTYLMVPILKESELIGAFIMGRREVRSFTDKQIELVKNFASQAVIAIDNARLLNELRQRTDDLTDSLEQQTATSEVLQVISSSPGDLGPVFASMLENAIRICDAKFGNIYRWDGQVFHTLATHNTPAAFSEARKRSPQAPPHPKSMFGQIAATKSVIHFADTLEQAAYRERVPSTVAAADLGGVRTALGVPMLKENELIGAFTLFRHEVRPFTEKQIALVTSFAAQAVIAIENARLLSELRQRTTDLTGRTADLTEALEQQTATSEVLQVISGSPGNLEPVFAAMLERAVRVCDAQFGNAYRWDGELLHGIASHHTPSAFLKSRERVSLRPTPKDPLRQMVMTKQVVHTPDVAASPSYAEREPASVAAVELGGVRTLLCVPMLKDGELIGAFTLAKHEVSSFTDKQIELVKNFAAQAVIAIENARLLSELRQRTDDLSEALEQQTATSDVLQVISSSPGDLQPVFATMLENATRICDAKFGNVYLWDSDAFHLVATHNTPPAFAESRKRGPFRPGPTHPFSRLVVTKQILHVDDVAALPGYLERDPQIVEPVELGGIRTCLVIPMLKDANLIGALVVFRQEVRRFNDKQIALLTNFAAQAVIAIENARLLNELRQRTDDLSKRTTTSPNRWSSKRLRRRCLRSSVVQRSICKRYLKLWPKIRSGSVRPTALSFSVSMGSCCVWRWPTILRQNLKNSSSRTQFASAGTVLPRAQRWNVEPFTFPTCGLIRNIPTGRKTSKRFILCSRFRSSKAKTCWGS